MNDKEALKEFADILQDMGNPAALTEQHVLNRASPQLRTWLAKNSMRVPGLLAECGYEAFRNRDTDPDPDSADVKWKC